MPFRYFPWGKYRKKTDLIPWDEIVDCLIEAGVYVVKPALRQKMDKSYVELQSLDMGAPFNLHRAQLNLYADVGLKKIYSIINDTGNAIRFFEDATEMFYFSTGIFNVCGKFDPYPDATNDIGDPYQRWRDLYLMRDAILSALAGEGDAYVYVDSNGVLRRGVAYP